MEFVKKFTPSDFQAKNFTPSISPNFNSFSKKKHTKWVKMEKFTLLAKILHCYRHWRHWQIPPLPLAYIYVIWGFLQHFSSFCYFFFAGNMYIIFSKLSLVLVSSMESIGRLFWSLNHILLQFNCPILHYYECHLAANFDPFPAPPHTVGRGVFPAPPHRFLALPLPAPPRSVKKIALEIICMHCILSGPHKKMQYNFSKMRGGGGGVEGHLKFFQKFIWFVSLTLTLTLWRKKHL